MAETVKLSRVFPQVRVEVDIMRIDANVGIGGEFRPDAELQGLQETAVEDN